MKGVKIKKSQIILLVVFGILLITGIFLGDAVLVFSKAVKICLECIGIG